MRSTASIRGWCRPIILGTYLNNDRLEILSFGDNSVSRHMIMTDEWQKGAVATDPSCINAPVIDTNYGRAVCPPFSTERISKEANY